jgi:hypothetical protein
MARTRETRTETLTLGDDGVMFCTVKPTAEHTLSDAVENVRASAELTRGRRVPMILDTRGTQQINREARIYYTGPENAKVINACAMLISSSAGKILGNFLMRVNHPPFPFRLFSDEASARAWLKEIGATQSGHGEGSR